MSWPHQYAQYNAGRDRTASEPALGSVGVRCTQAEPRGLRDVDSEARNDHGFVVVGTWLPTGSRSKASWPG
jgi:hypothetical protein